MAAGESDEEGEDLVGFGTPLEPLEEGEAAAGGVWAGHSALAYSQVSPARAPIGFACKPSPEAGESPIGEGEMNGGGGGE